MCGIVYFNNTKGRPVRELVRKAYKNQRSRGTQGFGFFEPKNNRLTHNTRERRILRLLGRSNASEILYHHRYPTSTENVRNACHPLSSKDHYENNYVMVHNGVIWNDDVVAKEQAVDGVSYISKQPDGRFNDSEVLLYDLADVIEGRKEKLSVYGSIAFIVVQMDKKGKRKALYFGRNSGSPLKVDKFEHGFSLRSVGDGVDVETNKLFKYDYETGKFSVTPLEIPSGYYTQKSTYGTYQGYGTGYDWSDEIGEYNKTFGYDRYGNKIDNNGFLLPDENSCNIFTEQVLERYKSTNRYGEASIDERMASKEVKGALLYDMNYSNEDAIQFGEFLLEELQQRYIQLEEIILSDGEMDGRDLDEYMALEEQIRILNRAVQDIVGTQTRLAIGY